MPDDLLAMLEECLGAVEVELDSEPSPIPPQDHGAATVTEWLRYVHEHAITQGLPGVVNLAAPIPKDDGSDDVTWKSRCYGLDELDAAGTAARSGSDGGLNMYYRTHLLDAPVEPWERGVGELTRWVTQYSADVDIAGPGHKPPTGKVLPTFEQAVELIDATLAPSAVIASGGGLYPIWRLAEPFATPEHADRQRYQNLGRRIDAALASHGFHVDATSLDLSRVIRPPGVDNRKPGRDVRPVTILRGHLEGAGDYAFDELENLLPPLPVKLVKAKGPKSDTGSTESAPWVIFADRYDVDDVLAADPKRQWEERSAKGGMRRWRYVGSSSDYSLKQSETGALIVWSSTIADVLGIEPGKAVDLWGLACGLAGRDPKQAARKADR